MAPGWGSQNDDWGSQNDDWGSKSDDKDSKHNDWGSKNDNRGSKSDDKDSKQDDWGSKSNDWGSKGNDWGSKGNDWGSKSDDKGFKRNDWGSKSDDRGSKSNDWGSESDDKGSKRNDWSSKSNDGGIQEGSSGWSSGQCDGESNGDRPQKRFKREDDGEQPERPAPYKPDDLNLDEEAEMQACAGENFQKYKDQKVTCLPKGSVKEIEAFEDIITSKLLIANLKSQKYSEMTPIQKWAMPAIMSGYDIIGCAQTGSGKTAAFLLPVLQTLLNTDLESSDPNSDCQNPYCLIISPTRELANQIYVHANILSKDSVIKCHVIYGQISTAHLKSKLCTGCHILVATPGRLKDFVQRGWIGFKNVKYVILDEGDRLVDEGFTTDIRGFFNHESMPPKEERQTLFFSATFKDATQLNAKEYLKKEFVFISVGKVGAANEDIKQEFLRVERSEKKRELKKILDEIPETDKCIVFTQTKSAADMLAGYFTALKLSSTSIHGDRLQSQREQAIKAFKKGEKRFLISSPVGNRGLDLPKVAIVINYDLPSSVDEYVHRIGRTGRAGHTGRAISFYDESRDAEILPELLEILKDAKQEIPDWMQGNQAVTLSTNDDDWGTNNQDDGDSAKLVNSDENQPKEVESSAQDDDGW